MGKLSEWKPFPRNQKAHVMWGKKLETSKLDYHFPRNLRVFGGWGQYWKLPKAMTINKWIISQIIGELGEFRDREPQV